MSSTPVRRFLLLAAITFGFLLPATAQDDRANIAPTLWQVWTGQSFNDINNTVGQGYRIVDIRIDNQTASTFTVTYVHNSGAHGRAWWYLIGVDVNGLSNFMTQNSARPTKLIAWDDGNGGTRLAAVMVPNTGADYKPYWWYVGVSAPSFFNSAQANNARPVSLDEYRIGTNTYFTGVMIRNIGADFRNWWMYVGLSANDIGTHVSQNQARLYSVQQNPHGTFNILQIADTVGPWWYWIGINAQQVLDIANNLGARVFELQNTGGTFVALMLRNDNDVERRAGDAMRGASDGTVGVFLKRVNGPVLASLNGGHTFEPASTIKTLIHYHALDQVRLGNAALSDNLTVYTGTNGSCPQSTNPVTESLSSVLSQMMRGSDNNRTLAAETRFGRAAINATATVLGLGSTAINHQLGCGGPVANRLSLADIGRLHELVANGSLGSRRTDFYNLMLNFNDNYAGGELNNVIQQEAAAVGLTGAQLTGFRSECRVAFKGGAYTFLGPTREYRSWGAYVLLPFYTNTGIVGHEYVTGSFVDGASDGNNANTAFNRGAAEVLRDEIRAAMTTWRNQVHGSWTPFGAGCRGTNGLVPVHGGTPAVPNIGTTIDWTLLGARANAFSALCIGYSRTSNNGQSLPLNLTSAGMPGCTLYTELFFTLHGNTTASGTRSLRAAMPNNAALIGTHTYSQYAVFDQGANATGVVWSNAQDLVLGGQR